jgi:acetylglutamate kinase
MGVTLRGEIHPTRSGELAGALEVDWPIANFAGKTVVIKYGGAAMERSHLKDGFSRDIAALRSAGVNPVAVHGGGRQITRLMEKSGKTPRFVGGMRVTDDATMDLIEGALPQINRDIARLITRHGASAVGLSAWQDPLIHARRMVYLSPTGESVDLGRVGDVVAVNTNPIRALQERGIVPVIGPVGVGADHRTYNINADLVAGEVAAVLGAALVIYLTDVPGILDRAAGCRFRRLSRWAADSLVREGVINDRMLPKVEGAVRALKGGAAQAQIIDGRVPHALALTLRAPHGIGTEIVF